MHGTRLALQLGVSPPVTDMYLLKLQPPPALPLHCSVLCRRVGVWRLDKHRLVHGLLASGTHKESCGHHFLLTFLFTKNDPRASLVVQWLRICLLMQRTRVRTLVWEDPTCRGATRPVSHNY